MCVCVCVYTYTHTHIDRLNRLDRQKLWDMRRANP